MYTRYFGLHENPFALSPDPRYLYLSRRHQEALAHLTFGINQGGGFVQLTGEVGTGKTMMIRTLLERLPDSVDVALVLYPFLSVREFVGAICADLRIPCGHEDSLKALIDTLNAYLLENHAKGRRTVLIIDEAQNLSHEVLEQIRLLTNLETTKEKLLQILLIGQPELHSLLAQPRLRQLSQRITARYDLAALSLAETRDYIAHRLAIAGSQTTLFNPAAVRVVHRLSGGIPRVINVICDRALLGAYALGKPTVDSRIIRRAATEIGQKATPVWRPALAAAVLLVGVVVLAAWQFAPDLFGRAPAGAETPKEPQAASAAAHEPTSLAALLARPHIVAGTDAALTTLFAQWQIDYTQLKGASGCERAVQAGLNCLLVTGTWNNLRQYNRPALLELVDENGTRHHAALTHLAETDATLDFGEERFTFSIIEIDRHWFGKALLLWKPAVPEPVLRRGMRGSSILWLRAALAQSLTSEAEGTMVIAMGSDLFDAELEAAAKEFQRRQQLPVDGVVGPMTLLRLPSDDPPLLGRASMGAE